MGIMINNIHPILDKILNASQQEKKREVIIKEFISQKVITDLKSRGYSIYESCGDYTIKW
jgi:hypothetical protein